LPMHLDPNRPFDPDMPKKNPVAKAGKYGQGFSIAKHLAKQGMASVKKEEASPMIKPPTNEFAKKEDAFAHAKKHGGKVMKKTFIHPTSGMKNISYVVREETELDEAKYQKLTPRQKFTNSLARAGYDVNASLKRIQDLLAKQKKEREEREKQSVAEGDSGAKYKVKSIGKDIKGDYYISPSTGKKVYKSGVNKGDHENPKTGEIKKGVAKTLDYFRRREQENKAKERVEEAGPFSYGSKPPRKGSVAYNALMKRKEQEKNKPPIEPKDQMVGTAKVVKELQDPREYDYEGDMAKSDLKSIIMNAQEVHDMLEDNTNLPEWVQSKITKSEDYISTVRNYMKSEFTEEKQHNVVGKKTNESKVNNSHLDFKSLREAAFNANCCEEDGFTEESFVVTGDEQYEDWGEVDDQPKNFRNFLTKINEEGGKTPKLNKPFLTPGGPKKRAVYVKNDKGNVVKVNFGDPNLEIKRDDPARRASFRARHGCDNPGPKWKANYWSCKFWSSTPVSKL